MDNLYQEVYQYLIDNNIEEQEAIEVVNHLYEANIHEYGLLTENRGNAILNMLRTAGMMSGILKSPAAQQTVKATTKKVLQGTPRQGSLFTKTGKPQNFTGGRTPFTGTNPVPAASSSLPKPPTKPAVSPGQMQIPGTSPRAQDLRNVTRNPNLGLPGNKQGFGATSPMPKPTPAGPPVKDNVSQSIRNLGTRNLSKPQIRQTNLEKLIGAFRRFAAPAAATGATGLALRGGQPSSKGDDPRRPDGSLPPYTPPRPTADPKPEPKPEPPSVKPAPATKLSAAAKDFDRAFAAAREKGQPTFPWRGKTYSTKYKGE